MEPVLFGGTDALAIRSDLENDRRKDRDPTREHWGYRAFRSCRQPTRTLRMTSPPDVRKVSMRRPGVDIDPQRRFADGLAIEQHLDARRLRDDDDAPAARRNG